MPITQAHVEKAIEQIEHRRRPSNVDFTQHLLEDGNIISIQERVIKDVRFLRVVSPRRDISRPRFKPPR
jgi:serine/threonine-protein phosphatase 2B catalytic subunit